MIFLTHLIDYLILIINQGNLVHDLSLSPSLLLLELLFIWEQVELIEDTSKFNGLPYTSYIFIMNKSRA